MAESPKILPRSRSAIRSMVEGKNYSGYESLAAAREQESAVVIFEGDDGGTIYLTAPIKMIECDEAALNQLLLDIDKICWGETSGASMSFESRKKGSGIAGGMGGGVITDGLWLHPRTEELGIRSEVQDVIAGGRERIETEGRDWRTTRPKPPSTAPGD